MAAITNQALLQGGFNNFGINWLTPATAAQNIIIADDKNGTNVVAEFDVTNLQVKTDTIVESTAAAGVTIETVLLKDGNVQAPNDNWFQGTTTGAAAYNIVRYNSSDQLEVGTQQDWLDALGLTIGAQTPTLDQDLQDIAGLGATLNNFIVGDGSSWTKETPSQARSSLGLGTIATQSTVDNDDFGSTAWAVASGGTGSTTAAGARTNLAVAKSGANSDITSLTNCSLVEDNAQMVIGTTTTVDLRFKYNGAEILTLTSGATLEPLTPGGANLGSATNYMNGINVERINFEGTQGTSTKDPSAVAEDGWIQIQNSGTDVYVPFYNAS